VAVLVIAAGAVFALLTARGTAVPPDPVTVSPAPGTVTAPPRTQISLRGLPAGRLGDIEVEGAQSGRHRGRLLAHSDDQGASFVPDEPFEPGERVTVRTGATVVGAEEGDFAFTVSRPARAPGPRVEPPRPGGTVQRFRTRPDLQPPAITVTKGSREPGYVFLAPKRGRGADGPVIVDRRGKVVWAHEAPEGEQALDFRVQRYQGKPVLTWWEGGLNIGVGWGDGVVYDESYREILRVRAGNGYQADLHEFLLTDRGTALMIIYDYVQRDLSAAGGPERGVVIDGVVQEIDLRTGLVRFEWHSLDHIGLDESRWPKPEKPGMPWDYVHLNSVGLDDDGDLLVSGRHSWGVYKVDSQTGEVQWRLGGTDSDFELDRAARFAFQHDVRRREDGALTMFDNAAGPPETREASRAIALELDTDGMTARLADAIEHPQHLLSDSQGNADNLPDGGTFVGWGSQPAFTEHAADGSVVFSGRIAPGNDNYRAHLGEWTGRPADKPAVAVEPAGGRLRVYASWNGATEVARWEVLTGEDAESLSPAGAAPRRGFETAVVVPGGASSVAARALDASGRELGVSEPVAP
jgi:hypothetical protein